MTQSKMSDPRMIETWLRSKIREWDGERIPPVMREVREQIAPEMHGFVWVWLAAEGLLP